MDEDPSQAAIGGRAGSPRSGVVGCFVCMSSRSSTRGSRTSEAGRMPGVADYGWAGMDASATFRCVSTGLLIGVLLAAAFAAGSRTWRGCSGMAALLEVDERSARIGRRELYRRCARSGEIVVDAAERVIYAVVKQS